MCVSFVIWGNLISSNFDMERLLAISLIYFVSLGIAAHVADNLGSKKIKPWGNFLNKKQSWIIILTSLTFSYSLGLYYAIIYSPLLIIIGVIEGFFLFAYNFELFNGFFHRNFWFAISWGLVPFLAGYVIQSNTISLEVLMISLIPFGLSYLEIKISRNYKEFKRLRIDSKKICLYENLLKLISLGTIISTGILLFLTIFVDIIVSYLFFLLVH